MKKTILSLPLLISLSLLFQSCMKDKVQSTYTYFLPVYKNKTEVLQDIKRQPPQPLVSTGKFFLYGKLIFINELNKGVHVIDNSNPRSPKNLYFISIPGNLDLAVKNTTLYADLYTDLLAIDISNPENVTLKQVRSNVFPERNYDNGFVPDSTKYIVDWIKKETTDKSLVNGAGPVSPPIFWLMSSDGKAAAPVAGISGSMARFTIVNNYLYTVGRSSLSSFNISNPEEPVLENTQNPGWNIETIYPLKDKLFIGSQTGMFIFSIADPASPLLLGSFSHACFNDPVIADDNYAYITLRARTDVSFCWGAAALQRNELDIVDITNLMQPSLVKVYDMEEPMGLSKDGDHLFLCDGKAGLKVYDAVDPRDLRLLKQVTNMDAFDVICQDGLAIVVAEEGIYQYDYTNINDIQLISKISAEN